MKLLDCTRVSKGSKAVLITLENIDKVVKWINEELPKQFSALTFSYSDKEPHDVIKINSSLSYYPNIISVGYWLIYDAHSGEFDGLTEEEMDSGQFWQLED